MDRCALILEAIKDKVVDDVKSIIIRIIILSHMDAIENLASALYNYKHIILDCLIDDHEKDPRFVIKTRVFYNKPQYDYRSLVAGVKDDTLLWTCDVQRWLPLTYSHSDQREWLINHGGKQS